MTEPEHTGNEAEKLLKEAWWHSKTLFATAMAHASVLGGAVFGVIMARHSPQTIGIIVAAQLPSHVAVQAGHTASERAQAASPYYPSGGSYAPGVTMPPPPSTITTTVTATPPAPPIEPAGSVATPISPAIAPTLPQAPIATGSHLGSPPSSS